MKFINLFITVIFIASLTACKSNSNISIETTPITPFEGVWRARGLGSVIRIFGNEFQNFFVTKATCTISPQMNFLVEGNTIKDEDNIIAEMYRDQDLLVIKYVGATNQVFEPMSQLPDTCINIDKTKLKDPVYNFEVFWNTYNENYPFFALRNVDWKAQHDQYVKQISSETSLINVLKEVTKPLNDCNASIKRSVSEDRSYEFPKDWMTFGWDLPRIVKTKYIIESQWAGRFMYGKINNRVGYLYVKYLNRIPENEYNLPIDKVEKQFLTELDEALQLLSGVETVIIDLRFLQSRSLTKFGTLLVSRFAKEKVSAYSIQMLDPLNPSEPQTMTEPLEITIEPAKDFPIFQGNVIVLTSPVTFSGDEQTVLALKAIAGTKIVGMSTAGCLSDIIFLPLPNGMQFGVSYQMITTPNGDHYEKEGIPPDKLIEMDKDDWMAGRDPILEEAIALSNE